MVLTCRQLPGWSQIKTLLARITCTILLAMPAISGSTVVAQVSFDQYEFTMGSAERQTVLAGFFLSGDMADLAVIHIDESDDRHLRIYAFADTTWLPALDATLGPDVLFVDVLDIDGRGRLVAYEKNRSSPGAFHGRLNWFDTDSGTEKELVAVSSNFSPPRGNEIPHVDITRDINGDGRDDLVVPDVDGFWLLIQTAGGTFTDPIQIGPPTEMSRITGADGYRYVPWSVSRVHKIDYDGNGRRDLVFWHDGRFEVHTQDERGQFSQATKTFSTDVSFDSDDLSMLAMGNMTGRVLHTLADLSGDGVADLVAVSLEGRKASSKHSTYEIHLGKRRPEGGIDFSRDASMVFESDERIQLGMDLHDLDSDGQLEIMFTTIEIRHLTSSLWKRLKGAMGDDIRLGLEFYRMEGGRYPDAPNAIRGIALDGVPSHREPGWVPLEIVLRGATHESRKTQKGYPRAFNTTLLIGDVTGDGMADLLKSDHPRIMDVFVGVPGPELFAEHPQNLRVSPPNDEEYTWLMDLNKDGKQDIVMHHPFTRRDGHGAREQPPGTEPHRVMILIARRE